MPALFLLYLTNRKRNIYMQTKMANYLFVIIVSGGKHNC